MIDCITVENMRLSDAKTIAASISGVELMYRAAKGVFCAVDWFGPVAIFAGSGNNGGDGFALASILNANGIQCTVFTMSSRLTPDSSFYAQKAENEGIEICSFDQNTTAKRMESYRIVVDCLLGTGFRGNLRDNYQEAIRCINQSGAYIVSVDINSGLNGDTGEAVTAVCSDLTVTIGYVKVGLISGQAKKFMKRLICIDIGIRLFRKEHYICSYDEWKQICAANSVDENVQCISEDGRKYYSAPSWLEFVPINVY